jgi:hypothetical protein
MGCGGGRSASAAGVEGDSTTSDDDDEEDEEVRASSFAASDVMTKSPAAAAAAVAGAVAVASRRESYCLVACKQMVGLFATVWVRRGLVPHVGHVRFSCVGRGIMGYLGNKVLALPRRRRRQDRVMR